MFGGLTLTAAQRRVSTSSMLTFTVVTQAEGVGHQTIEGHLSQAEARGGHLVAEEEEHPNQPQIPSQLLLAPPGPLQEAQEAGDRDQEMEGGQGPW